MSKIRIDIVEEKSKISLEMAINRKITSLNKRKYAIVNIQYSSGNGKYSAMITYKKN